MAALVGAPDLRVVGSTRADALAALADAGVIGVPDSVMGQKTRAYVALRPGTAQSEELKKELIEFCRQRLASFKKPERVHFVEALPKNQMGKVLKKDLRAQLAES